MATPTQSKVTSQFPMCDVNGAQYLNEKQLEDAFDISLTKKYGILNDFILDLN